MKKLIAVLCLIPSISFAQPTDSLFFSSNELIAIVRAMQGYVPPQKALEMAKPGEVKEQTEPRLIRLSGILYNRPGDWTVWLNGERVGPKNMPERVMGLEVESDKIHLKWMDLSRQRVVNIVLRSHQTYDLDSDTILISTDYQ